MPFDPAPLPVPRAAPELAEVRRLPSSRTDAELIEGLRSAERWATAAVFERYGQDVRRILTWVLGADRELPDLLHDVFVRAFEGIGDLSSPARLRPWLLSIAVYTARECIRRRQRERWYRLIVRRDPSDSSAYCIRPEDRQLVSAARGVLARLSVDERIVFSLRLMGDLSLGEVADACGVSLATVKRRLASARTHFESLARRDPVLRDWLEEAASCNDV